MWLWTRLSDFNIVSLQRSWSRTHHTSVFPPSRWGDLWLSWEVTWIPPLSSAALLSWGVRGLRSIITLTCSFLWMLFPFWICLVVHWSAHTSNVILCLQVSISWCTSAHEGIPVNHGMKALSGFRIIVLLRWRLGFMSLPVSGMLLIVLGGNNTTEQAIYAHWCLTVEVTISTCSSCKWKKQLCFESMITGILEILLDCISPTVGDTVGLPSAEMLQTDLGSSHCLSANLQHKMAFSGILCASL